MAVKGKTNNPGGRPKGSKNKATQKFKEALNELMERAAPDMIEWLAEIECPYKRFEVLSKFAEFIYPKLARTENSYIGKDGEPADPGVKVEIVDNTNTNT